MAISWGGLDLLPLFLRVSQVYVYHRYPDLHNIIIVIILSSNMKTCNFNNEKLFWIVILLKKKIFSSFIIIFAWNISIYYLTNFFIFCESVEVKYCKYQCFSHYIAIRNLTKTHNVNRKKYKSKFKLTLNLNDSLKTGSRVFLWTFVSNFLFLSGRR